MARTVEIAEGLHISTTMWNRMQRERQEEMQFRLKGKDQEWEATLSQIQAFVLSKVQAEDVACPWIVRRRLEQISEYFSILSLKFQTAERKTL